MISDPPLTNLVQGSDSNEHYALEGHRKKNITGTVLDSPFTNLLQISDSNKKPMLIGTKPSTK